MGMSASSAGGPTPLRALAALIRSKNAGPFLLTFDIMFSDAAAYRRVTDSGVISPALFAELYDVQPDSVRLFQYEPGLAVKVTIRRPVPSGDPGDSDVFGGQLYPPLCDVLVPGAAEAGRSASRDSGGQE